MESLNVRKELESDLEGIRRIVLRLGKMSEHAITQSVSALRNADMQAAREVIDGDDALDFLALQIEERCMWFVARYHPMGQDLRTALSVLHIAMDLERIGDYGVNISRTALALAGTQPVKRLVDIPKIADVVATMVQNALAAFDCPSEDGVIALFTADEQVDALEKSVLSELLLLDDVEHKMASALALISVARALERAGDHVTNIGERVYYILTGRNVKAWQYKTRHPRKTAAEAEAGKTPHAP